MTVREWYQRKTKAWMRPLLICLALGYLWGRFTPDRPALRQFIVLYCLIAGFLLSMLIGMLRGSRIR